MNLLQSSTERLYERQKVKSIAFWNSLYPLPRGVFSVCVVCIARGYRGYWCHSPPDAHHLVVPKNYGVVVNEWWNLVPVHHGCHDAAHGLREVLLALLARHVGSNQIRSWVAELDLDVTVDLPLPD